jgi:hypothetical protein
VLPEPNFPVAPDQFIGRQNQIGAYEEALRQSLLTGRMASFAVLGDWGIGKSSLLLKFASICARSEHRLLPISLSVGEELGNYRGLAESLLDNLAETLATMDTVTGRIRAEVQNWELKRVKVGNLSFNREARHFLSSGSSLLKHALAHAWRRFLKPTHFLGAIFFLDDLDNLTGAAKVALAIRDQFQSFGTEGMNYSVCFSARPDYFSWVRNLAEPAVRFYSKAYLAPFTLDETNEYVQAVFTSRPDNIQELAEWLYEKTLGHPYFLAFISQQLLAQARGSPMESPARLWPGIFRELERQKFSSDLAQLSEKEVELLQAAATTRDSEFSPAQFVNQPHYEYFRRLMERGLLIRTGRGRYKLYHPLFKLFLQGLKP